MKCFRVLALDPGIVNFGYSLLKVENRKISIIRCGTIHRKYLISDINTQVMRPKFQRFIRMFKTLLKKSKPDAVIFERFIIQRRGLSGEGVNQMIAAIVLTCGITPSTQVMAATWKARIKKLSNNKTFLDQMYKAVKPVPDHAVDATFQGLFFIEKELQIPINRFVTSKRLPQEIQKTHKGVLEFKNGRTIKN